MRSLMGECGEIKLMKSGFLLQIEENIQVKALQLWLCLIDLHKQWMVSQGTAQ
jgi:hypothetical protein